MLAPALNPSLNWLVATVSAPATPTGFDRLMNAIAANWFWTVILLIVVVSVVFGCIGGMVRTSARERTRREIAAYIAEGSMTPEQGERLISAKFRDGD